MQPTEPHLRGKETTAEGRHLEMPDAFPHVMMARLAVVAVGAAIVTGAFWAFGGATVAVVGGLILVVVVFPYVMVRMIRSTRRERAVEIEEERQVEAHEAGLPAHPPASGASR